MSGTMLTITIAMLDHDHGRAGELLPLSDDLKTAPSSYSSPKLPETATQAAETEEPTKDGRQGREIGTRT